MAMFTRTMTPANLVLCYIAANDGVTQSQLIDAFPPTFFDTGVKYGAQRKASNIIAMLRQSGLLKDVRRRCGECGSALTRGDRNVALRVTQRGRAYVKEMNS